jgi:hypothetical protein
LQSVSEDLFSLPAITPAPDGPLVARARCRTSRTGGRVTYHGARIAPDWSVTTPHDIALERIAGAMGGYLSCVDLVDAEVPALRELAQLRARRVVPQISRNVAGRWTLGTLPADCTCVPFGFASAAEAAEHARDPLHIGRLHGVVPRVLLQLLAQVEEAHGTGFYLPSNHPDAHEVVRERDGVAQLWDAGVHPIMVRRLHDALWPGGPALPVLFYLGAVTRRPDLGWIARTLAEVPDEDVAVWLCWTDTELDRRHPDARIGWLRSGVPRRAIAALAEGAYSPVDVAELARGSGRSAASAACAFAGWHRAGCHPSVGDLLVLQTLDVDPWFEPSIGAVDWLWDRVKRSSVALTRTEVALLLAVCGTRAGAMKMVTERIHDPRLAALAMRCAAPTLEEETNR